MWKNGYNRKNEELWSIESSRRIYYLGSLIMPKVMLCDQDGDILFSGAGGGVGSGAVNSIQYSH